VHHEVTVRTKRPGSDTLLDFKPAHRYFSLEWASRFNDSVDHMHEFSHAGPDDGFRRQPPPFQALRKGNNHRGWGQVFPVAGFTARPEIDGVVVTLLAADGGIRCTVEVFT